MGNNLDQGQIDNFSEEPSCDIFLINILPEQSAWLKLQQRTLLKCLFCQKKKDLYGEDEDAVDDDDDGVWMTRT